MDPRSFEDEDNSDVDVLTTATTTETPGIENRDKDILTALNLGNNKDIKADDKGLGSVLHKVLRTINHVLAESKDDNLKYQARESKSALLGHLSRSGFAESMKEIEKAANEAADKDSIMKRCEARVTMLQDDLNHSCEVLLGVLGEIDVDSLTFEGLQKEVLRTIVSHVDDIRSDLNSCENSCAETVGAKDIPNVQKWTERWSGLGGLGSTSQIQQGGCWSATK